MSDALLLGRPHAFERGDKVYLTTPVTGLTPSEQQITEFAFASAVKSSAPNENIGWLQGRYVEAGRPNLNHAMWLSDELALKSATPALQPVTVMHDPRTAVGVIADVKLIQGGDTTATSRLDTILAVWKHRFGDIWEEAELNLREGTLMQSMECLSPSYCCSDCGRQYIKLQEGKEQASWCEHLRSNSSHRILQDVCFTGTGLIFGTRGGQGAYTEAHLDHFQDEIAEFHTRAHIDGNYQSSEGSTPKMGYVQIDETELAGLRSTRDEAIAKAAKLPEAEAKVTDLTTKLETQEAATATEKTRADKAEQEKAALEATAQSASLKDKRLSALGTGFTAKLGEFTRERLGEAASTQSDEDWESTLKEKEEMAGVKRDAKADGSTPAEPGTTASTTGSGSGESATGSAFSDEELARFTASGVAAQGPAGSTGQAARKLARSFSRPRTPAPAPAETK